MKKTIKGVNIYTNVEENEKSYSICWIHENREPDSNGIIFAPYTTELMPTKLYCSPKIMESSGRYTAEDVFIENQKPIGIIEDTFVIQSEYDKFMKQYHEEHKCCPKCGCEEHLSSLVGYVLNLDKKDEYKDKNSCVCSNCGLKHITHDRVAENKHDENYTNEKSKYRGTKRIIHHIVVGADISDIEIEIIIDNFYNKYNN
jgi:hypothetical protein